MFAFDTKLQRSCLLLACLLATVIASSGCGDDRASLDGPTAGSAGVDGTHGGSSGSSGASGGHSGANGGEGATGAGAGSEAGSGGEAGGSGSDGGEPDSGVDSSVPPVGNLDPDYACGAPVPATDPGQACPSSDPVPLKLTPINTTLDVPLFVAQAPGDDARLFVAERTGQIKILDAQTGEETGTFLDLTSTVVWGGEFGLLGFAFHPNYPDDPRIFVNYTVEPEDNANELDTLVSSFEVSSNPDVIDMASEQILLRFGQPGGTHKAGMVAFGPDDCLYVSSGDGGKDVSSSQDLSLPLGKMLRLDVDAPSSAAPGNVDAAYKHIWSYGLRNPWRFSFDRSKGDMYIGDVSDEGSEEVNIAPRGVGHQNYGWYEMEGSQCNADSCDGLIGPTYEYAHVEGGKPENCVIGGYVYRGTAIPSLAGWYVFADNGDGHVIRAMVWDGEDVCGEAIKLSERDSSLSVTDKITSLGEGQDGELYLTTMSGLYRFDEAE